MKLNFLRITTKNYVYLSGIKLNSVLYKYFQSYRPLLRNHCDIKNTVQYCKPGHKHRKGHGENGGHE
jgi:hypothetical protein